MRRVVHYGVTRAPSDRWVAQPLCETTPYNDMPRFLIRDNDSKFGRTSARVAVNTSSYVWAIQDDLTRSETQMSLHWLEFISKMSDHAKIEA
jgi:hypothetical protein